MERYLCEDTLKNIIYPNQILLVNEYYLRYIFLVVILVYIMHPIATENICYLQQIEVQETRNNHC